MSRSLQITLPFEPPVPADPWPAGVAVPAGPAGRDAVSDSCGPAPPAAGAGVAGPRPGHAPPGTPQSLEPMYFVRHRRARRYLLRVEPDGRLRITIPRGGSKRDAQAFAARNLEWVARQRARAVPSTIDAVDRPALRQRAVLELPRRLRELAQEHQVAGLTRVTIRNQRTRWGSCGRDGHISLNWRLVLMPPAVRDYVLVHELMHLRRMDHSPAYWALVAAACPDYATARAWLRTHGRALR